MSVCWFTVLGVSPGGNLNLDVEGKERTKKEADPSRLVGGSFHKQGHLTTRLLSGSCKMSRSLPPPARILGVYIEALVGFSLMYRPDGLNTTSLSQGCVLEMAPAMGTGGRMHEYVPRTGGEEPLIV